MKKKKILILVFAMTTQNTDDGAKAFIKSITFYNLT